MENLSLVVDELGMTRARIAELREKEAYLEAKLKDEGHGKYQGAYFSATVSAYERTKVDYKGIIAKLKPSVQLMTAHTKYIPVVRIDVNARPVSKPQVKDETLVVA